MFYRHKSYLEKYQVEFQTDASARKDEAEQRKEWEQKNKDGKSALSRRMNSGGKPDMFTSSVVNPDSIAAMADDKTSFQQAMQNENSLSSSQQQAPAPITAEAAARVSKIIATAGAGEAFEGQTLGVGGLDDVLMQVKRRIWTPLAAPPQLLKGNAVFVICIVFFCFVANFTPF